MKKELTIGEQELFDQLDALEFSEAELALTTLSADPGLAAPSEEELEALKRIKLRTLSLIKAAPAEQQPLLPSVRRSRRQAYTGVAAALLLAAGLVFTSPSVQAGLKQVFSFLPGLHTVVENSPDSPLYVLKKPFTTAVGKGELTVNAILVQENRATINLRGQQTPLIREFQAEIGGTRYTFTFNSRSSGGNDWDASYSALLPPDLALQAEEPVTLYINGAVLGPLVVGPPETADDLQQLGVSDIQQNVRISAFPVRLEDGLVRVELVPSLLQTASAASSYTLEPLRLWNGTYVKNAAGAKVPAETSPSSIGYYSELMFREQKDAGEDTYTVVIPYIEVSDQEAVSREVTLPLPAIGEKSTLDITAEIVGVPVEFTSITRSSETEVSVDIDLKFDPARAKSLTRFSLSYPGSKEAYSFGWEESEENPRVMKTLYLNAEPGADKLRFNLSKPIFIWKGPWTLPLKLGD